MQVQKEEKDAELKTSFLIQELWHLVCLHVVEETQSLRRKRKIYLLSGSKAAAYDAIYS
ncbi:MAG: hypothetical protein ACLTRS_02565 [Lachnospiraceae bacterium]